MGAQELLDFDILKNQEKIDGIEDMLREHLCLDAHLGIGAHTTGALQGHAA
jgi:hypothetical protein